MFSLNQTSVVMTTINSTTPAPVTSFPVNITSCYECAYMAGMGLDIHQACLYPQDHPELQVECRQSFCYVCSMWDYKALLVWYVIVSAIMYIVTQIRCSNNNANTSKVLIKIHSWNKIAGLKKRASSNISSGTINFFSEKSLNLYVSMVLEVENLLDNQCHSYIIMTKSLW